MGFISDWISEWKSWGFRQGLCMKHRDSMGLLMHFMGKKKHICAQNPWFSILIWGYARWGERLRQLWKIIYQSWFFMGHSWRLASFFENIPPKNPTKSWLCKGWNHDKPRYFCRFKEEDVRCNVGPPGYVCWFRFAPVTIVIYSYKYYKP